MRSFIVLLAFTSFASAASPTPTPAAPAAAKPPAPPSPYEGEGWKVSVSAPKGSKVGAHAALDVSVATHGGYHLNDDYPINFVTTAVEGVAFDSVRLDKKAATLAPCKSGEHACAAKMPVAFTPKAEGAQKVSGTFSFAVCDEKSCAIEKVPVVSEVVVTR